ncbi:cysteine proteinase [Myriangium duriaei CBS 260.36]|uniref:Ubiquitin carboxyl-terminal hydrolase n=1 Tax=Myriangium duriaei CBS 260.36 TaxID=1168546 RepID=A0A9P4J7W6_9PEZI|nr:cysteine proteinase [Myriangium duriaei CBS 260.36]
MPERPLQIAAYAAGASLAAATLVYVFGPTFFLDDDAAHSSKSSRKRGVVGLSNPANDCFINSVLQTLAGLPELRLYLIRELHLRALAGKGVYDALPEPEKKKEQDGEEKENEIAPFNGRNKTLSDAKVLSLQRGIVTSALKEILDSLNERPIYKKTLSAGAFVGSLEQAFRTRINRNQQDAQEFLQLVTERLCDEHHAGRKARDRAAAKSVREKLQASEGRKIDSAMDAEAKPDEQGFPFEGKIESQIECTFCHFKPKPSASSFVTLTLHVPQGGSATTLSACFDSMLKVEHIDDFKCARCRVQHALDSKAAALAGSHGAAEREELQRHITALEKCMATDPEEPPKDIPLPNISEAPRRRIARHSRISVFPAVLAIHLSRSMWDTSSVSAKNMTKVSFGENLPLGGLLNQVNYRLLGMVTHKGGHNSGHYESLRRQAIGLGREPYSTPNSFGAEGAYSLRPSPRASGKASPALDPVPLNGSPASSPLKLSQSRSPSIINEPPASPVKSSSSSSLRRKTSLSRVAEIVRPNGDLAAARKAKKMSSRWWRISDDKIKECSTKDVLGMQREVYLLFFEMMPRTNGQG